MPIFYQLLGIFWLLLPAGFSNMTPVFVKKVNFLNYPIDGGATFCGRELLGANKTWRGLFFGTIAAIIIAYLQVFLYPYVQGFTLLDYSKVNPFMLGLLLGLGALVGDSVKSFFKRQMGISPGQTWWFFDQVDWIVGGFFFLAPYYVFGWNIYVVGVVMMGILHPMINILGYLLGIKKNVF